MSDIAKRSPKLLSFGIPDSVVTQGTNAVIDYAILSLIATGFYNRHRQSRKTDNLALGMGLARLDIELPRPKGWDKDTPALHLGQEHANRACQRLGLRGKGYVKYNQSSGQWRLTNLGAEAIDLFKVGELGVFSKSGAIVQVISLEFGPTPYRGYIVKRLDTGKRMAVPFDSVVSRLP